MAKKIHNAATYPTPSVILQRGRDISPGGKNNLTQITDQGFSANLVLHLHYLPILLMLFSFKSLPHV